MDTNVLLAGLRWHGPPHALLTRVRSGSLGLTSSRAPLAGLADVLGRPKFDAILKRSNTSLDNALAEVWRLADVIHPPPLPQPLSRDPDDDEVLALAVAAQADLIVSGDSDLLVLQHSTALILNPAQSVARLQLWETRET